MAAIITIEILLILLLVLANGVFAMSEIALVSARRARLQRMANGGNRKAAAALRLAENPDRFLSTVQIGITLIGVFAGAFGGATLAEQIEERLKAYPQFAPYSEAIGVMIVVVCITYLSLILGELVPKRLALHSPERIAAAVATPMTWLSRVAAPVVAFLSASTRAVFALLPIRDSAEPAVTEEEVKLLLHQATQAGTIERHEREIVERVFRLGDRRVTAVMTPRIDVVWLDVNRPVAELRTAAAAAGHTRFPVADGSADNPIGIIHVRDLFSPTSDRDLRSALQPPLVVPKTTPAFELLERFRESRNHVALVADEYGGVIGLVTPADILEALVGELPHMGDESEPAVFQRADGSWSFDAALDLEEAKSVLDIPSRLEGQKEHEFQTIAGYVIQRLGRIPKLGETVDAGGYRFEILDMDGRRVDRILATRIEPGI